MLEIWRREPDDAKALELREEMPGRHLEQCAGALVRIGRAAEKQMANDMRRGFGEFGAKALLEPWISLAQR